MTKRAAERHAIFTAHGEKCYMCGRPLTMKTMEVDHVIPQTLVDKPDVLAKALAELGRPADFNLNSYENLLPACGPCNSDKSDMIWEPSLAVQRALQKAKTKASRVAALVGETLCDRDAYNALNVLERIAEDGELTGELTDDIVSVLYRYQKKVREPEQATAHLRLTPSMRIINLTAPVGFTEKTLDLFRSHEHVQAIIDAKRAADGRYHDIWLHVTEEFADFAVAYARNELEDGR